MGYPSLGSWVTYGLGSESENLPAFVVMTQPEGTPEGGAPCWGRASCPRSTRGRSSGSGPNPIVNLKPARRVHAPTSSARTLDLLRAMNEDGLDPADTELSARIASYELAFRMQSAAPEAVDLSREPADDPGAVRPERPADGRVRHPLPARPAAGRARRPVRPALLRAAGRSPMQWDAHDDLDANHEKMCGLTDKPVAALLTDLKRTGPARRHAGRLGRRVRPDAREPEGRPGPRPQRRPASPCGWPGAAFKGGRSSARPTRSA